MCSGCTGLESQDTERPWRSKNVNLHAWIERDRVEGDRIERDRIRVESASLGVLNPIGKNLAVCCVHSSLYLIRSI